MAHGDPAGLIELAFDYFNDTRRLMTLLARHNDVIAVPIFDPLSQELPERGRLVVSDGELQLELDTAKGGVRRKLIDMTARRLRSIMEWWEELAIPVAPLMTDRDPVEQIRDLLGQARAVGVRR